MYRLLNVGYLGISGRQSEIIELTLSHGFKGIDLDIADFGRQVEASGLPHAKRLIESAKIKVGTFRLPFDLGDDLPGRPGYAAQLASVPKLAELAANVGCRGAVVRIEPGSNEVPFHANFERCRQRLAELGQALQPFGLKLGVEFDAIPAHRAEYAFQYLTTFEALVQLVKMTSGDNVGVVADLWQIYVGGGSIAELKNLPASKIVEVILSDLPAGVSLDDVNETSRLLPGEGGQIDSVAALTLLAEQGYDGPVTPRADRSHVQGKSRDATAKLVAERLTGLWKQAGLNAQGKLAAPVGK